MNATTLIREKPVKPSLAKRESAGADSRRWIPAYGGAHP